MPRLLICNTCKTVDTLGDYASENDPEAKHDHQLINACDTHIQRYGGPIDRHKAALYLISEQELDLIDKSRLEQAVHDNRLEAFLREERDNFKADALKCYELHNRPTYGVGYGSGCSDYRADHRAFGRTKGIPKEQWNYVCDFCPYNSYVEHYKNKNNKSLYL